MYLDTSTPYIMPPNGTTSTLLMSAENPNTYVRPTMDSINSAPTVLTLSTSACATPLQPSDNRLQELNMKCEADRLTTYDGWKVSFMDTNLLAAAGFYYTNRDDVVRCAFCEVEVGQWEEGDDPFRDHQRWAPSCGFIRGLQVGNGSLGSDGQPGASSSIQEPSHSYDVCGPYMESRPYSGPERAAGSGMNRSLLISAEMRRHGVNQYHGPLHPFYATYEARVQSYENWPRSLKQKPDRLSEAGFFYTGTGDQTVCFHCGGGLRDWEETDDPWVEHAAWFPKCMHVVLIKGQEFIEECRRLKKAEAAFKDQRHLLADILTSQAASSSGTSAQSVPQVPVSAPPVHGSEEKVIDDARTCQLCLSEERRVVFLPCGHLVACVKCAPSLSTCAVCRQPITSTVIAYIS